MPATYTHAVFGQKVLMALDPALRERIEKHRDLYDIGLHGPDILCFRHPLTENPLKAKGYRMHNEPARSFFEGARQKIAAAEDPEAALIYILGFINHFVLDSECHPLIAGFQKSSGLSHSEIESELDRALMKEQGLDPIRTRTTTHLHPSASSGETIAPFFECTGKEIVQALRSMIFFLNLFVAPGRLKRGLIFFVMKRLGLYENLGGLVFNRQDNPRCVSFTQQLQSHVDQMVVESVRLIHEYLDTLQETTPLDERYDEDYE